MEHLFILRGQMLKTDKKYYFHKMNLKGRLLFGYSSENKVIGVVTFFLTNDPNRFIRDDIWSVPKEDENGKYIYLDRIVTNRNIDLASQLEILKKYFDYQFPNKQIIWHSRRRKLCSIPSRF